MYNTIETDFTLPQYLGKRKLSRSKLLDNSIRTIFFVDANTKAREFGVKLECCYDIEFINAFPKWKGIDICVERMHDYEEKGYDCIIFHQLERYEEHIFEIIIDDIFKSLKCLKDPKNISVTLMNVLMKWKRFFESQQEIRMPEIKQQGLYGELLFLEELIKRYGGQAIFWWTGCNMETHDFYIDTHAVEVKTTSAKEKYKINISSEYQLDPVDVSGKLFLKFIALRKSIADGECLPEIVKRIKSMIINQRSFVDEFNNKLFRYGYIKDHPDLYTIGFKNREVRFYEINEKFPKVTSKDLPSAINNITYMLNLGSCNQFQISEDDLYKKLKRDNNDN